jgi:quinol monooxygenase YgiN
MLERRHVLIGAALAASGPALAAESPRHGLIGRIKALPGKRAELLAILGEGTGSMPGCLSYIVAEDAADPDTLWVTEVWESRRAHADSLKLPQVRAAIAKGRPLIAGFDSLAQTSNAIGHGLVRS